MQAAVLAIAALVGDVRAAIDFVAPEYAGALRKICHRESRCRKVGVHAIDGWTGAVAYRKAVSAGLLDPDRCPFHRRGKPERWATRGPFGMIAAYAVPYIGCVPPEILDWPIVSAYVAAEKYRLVLSGKAPAALIRWAEV